MEGGGDGQIKTWVSDRLMALLGYSRGVVVQLVVRLARDCASAADLAARLVDLGGFPSSPDTTAFAEDVYGRVPHNKPSAGAAAVSEYRKQMQDAAALAKKQGEFKLLDDDDDDVEDDGIATSAATNKVSISGRKRFRTKDASQDEDEDDAAFSDPDPGRDVRRRQCPEEDEDSSDAADEEEAELRRDQDERTRLERNIRERDDANTRKLMARKPSKHEQAKLARRSEAMDSGGDTSDIRRASRRAYLQKRKEQKVEAMRDEILDHEFMFGGVRITDAEEREIRRKKEVYSLVSDRADHDDSGEYYRMPDAYDDAANVDQEKRFSVARQRYDEDDRQGRRGGGSGKANAYTEQESWEEQQIRKSRLQFGSKDRGRASDEYDLVFEDAVEFVKSSTMEGTDDLADETDAKATLQRELLEDERKTLPVYKFKDELLAAVAAHQVLVVVGETGSGKTTQIPQYLHEAGYTSSGRKVVACTQPRRVAAMSVAARVAGEMGVKLGHEVGYSIRFEDCTSDRTVLKYMTDGMLLREFLGEPDLASYGVVVVDEAHERSVSTDVLLGLVKDVARFRPDLKVLVSSATLNAERFSDFFDGAPVFRIPGRRYRVDIHYTVAPEADYVDAAVATVLQLHVTEPRPGDILVFLTGQEEIETVEEILRRRTRGLGTKIAELLICPIYANLPTELQAKIFEPTPPGARKVVLASNLAETSLTIDGIAYVVDPGFCKRAGRSGRTGPGKCFRLFTRHSFDTEMEDETVPEIQRCNLASVVLSLKALGIHDLVRFDFMDPPATEALLRALEDLFALGALNSRGQLTKTGRRMAELPLDPMLAKAIVASEVYGCAEEMLTVASMLSAGNAVFYRPRDKAILADAARQRFDSGNAGDHVALLNVYTEWEEAGYSSQWCADHFVQSRTMRRARDVREQLEALMERVEIERRSCRSSGGLDAVKKAITAGFFRNTAQRRKDGSYRTLKRWRTVFVHPSSGLARANHPPRFLVYHELVETTKEYMRQVTEIKPEWLLEIAPHYYKDNNLNTPEPKKKG
ncbi:hypothetical protein PR202_gb01129 [Eleusine coracana subsp. coracana]|uniref:RNA helicase n=1 Tax=Eleusine coracana subsp. coracana TaxID=191504 RepID=A0AAV5DUA3_ELECO|nr:hypothetical protein PR202_gb01129 [Eleusine coracana subsp. coracana]